MVSLFSTQSTKVFRTNRPDGAQEMAVWIKKWNDAALENRDPGFAAGKRRDQS
jgi:hypothetical protein